VFDQAFGPFFLKLSSCFPYTTTFCFNRHDYLKRRLARAGIAYQAFNNGLRSCVDPTPRQIGFPANPRLWNVQTLCHYCPLREDAFQQVKQPCTVSDQRVAGLRAIEPRVHLEQTKGIS
jgi:hypothetical protein